MQRKRLLLAFITLLLLVCGNASHAQTKEITGTVTDEVTGQPLSGVTVEIKGTSYAAVTDTAGRYHLNVPDNATLRFSYVGYATKEVPVAGSVADVILSPSAASLENIVVIGYGTVKKKDLTGAVSTISSKDFNQGLSTTPEQLIAGKVAGVTITPNGGQPGQGGVIRIRQGASLNASNDPLIVVDGVPYASGLKDGGGSENQAAGVSNPLALINPDDIETFTVLKDAASTAIYGSRASNGVILITTKKGKRGKPVVNFSTQFTASTPSKYVPVLTADEFREYVKTYGKPSDTAELGTASTDWQKEIYRTAIGTNNNVSLSGSIPQMQNLPYRLALGYSNQNGILLTDNLKRYTGALRLNPQLLDKHLSIDLNINGAITDQRFANQDAIGAAVRMDPTQPIYEEGSPYGGYYEWRSNGNIPNSQATRNPVALLMNKMDKGQVRKLFGNVQFDYKFHFLPDLHANLNLGYEGSTGEGSTFKPTTDASAWGAGIDEGQGYQSKYKQTISNRTFEFYLNYNKDISSIKSNINAVAGYGYYDYLTTNFNYASLYANGDTVVSSVPKFPYDKPRYTLLSYYGRLIYTFNNKYILAASYRTDGSSRFAKENRWGAFPTVAFTWRVNEEEFLASSRALSDLKLRLSYGVTGQQAGIPLYSYIPNYSLSTNASLYQIGDVFYSLYAPLGYNADIRWEQTGSYNIGIDYGFINNRINGSIDLYKKITTNLLNTINVIPGTNFANQITANVGEMETKGVEFLINAAPVVTEDVQWDFGFNFSYNERKVTKLTVVPDPAYIGIQSQGINGTGNYIQITSVGSQPNEFYVYKQVYDPATGKPIENAFIDLNGDKAIDTKDFYHYKSPFPKYTMGFSTTFRYKKWSLNTALHSNIGNYVYNQVRSNDNGALVLNPLSYLQNATKDLLYTRFASNGTEIFSDYYVENASFLKMDNIGLTYNFGKIHNNLRLSATGNVQNVFTITKYSGLDPEIYNGVDNNAYPRPRIFMLGLNLTF